MARQVGVARDRLPPLTRLSNLSVDIYPSRLLQRSLSYFSGLMGRGRTGPAPVLATAAAGDGGPEAAAPSLLPSQATTPVSTSKRKKLVEASLHVKTNQRQLQPKADRIAEQLAKLYPNPPIPLNHDSNFQLLCAVLLSAQTTDIKVNEVTKDLFDLAPDAASMAALDVAVITAAIKTLGLAPTKAKNLKAMATLLLERHGGEVPESFEELEELPGVGHKTASVVMAQAFGYVV